jgi:hypothetical protein
MEKNGMVERWNREFSKDIIYLPLIVKKNFAIYPSLQCPPTQISTTAARHSQLKPLWWSKPFYHYPLGETLLLIFMIDSTLKIR